MTSRQLTVCWEQPFAFASPAGWAAGNAAVPPSYGIITYSWQLS